MSYGLYKMQTSAGEPLVFGNGNLVMPLSAFLRMNRRFAFFHALLRRLKCSKN